MKKIRYYKAIKDGKKKRFVESWGEPLNIKLPCGTVIKCACEFYRGEGWNVTDIATGYVVQRDRIPNKTARSEYFKNAEYLQVLSRIVGTEYYKQSAKDLEEYQKQFI